MKKSIVGIGFTIVLLALISGCSSSETPSGVSVPVLMYHHISENENDWGSATISPERFKEDMLYLNALGFESILPEDLVDFEENGTPLPKQPILITFDDGYRSNYTLAYPILKELGMKAVINVIVSSVGRDQFDDGTPITPHFSWEEAKEMMDSGLIDIQHHTYDLHKPGDGKYGKGVAMNKNETIEDYLARLKEDTLQGEKELTEHLGKKPVLFAYPYGVFTKESETVLKELGYKITLTVKNGASNVNEGLFLLDRINMPQEKESPVLMKAILNELNIKKPIPFEEINDAKERIKKLQVKAEASK